MEERQQGGRKRKLLKKQDRDTAINELLKNGNGIKNFYRFAMQNPQFDLYEASQIVIERPNATICFSFDEWNAMDRRVTKGRIYEGCCK